MSTTLPTPPVLSGGKGLLGHVKEFTNDRHALFHRGQQELGAIYTLKMPGQKIAVLNSPDYLKKLFEETDKSLSIEKGLKMFKPIFGEIGLIAGKETYQNQRPVIYESFKRKRMATHIQAMQIETTRWLKGLDAQGELVLQDHMITLTQQVATLAFFGKEFQNQVGPTFWEQFKILSDSLDLVLPGWLPLPKFRRRDKAKEVIVELVSDIIAERQKNANQYDDFLQTYIETPLVDGTHLSVRELAIHVISLAFAGHETTSIQAAWTMIQLLQNPEYLALVQREVDTHLPQGTVLTPDLLMKLEHVFWAVDETTRMRPSADMTQRVVEKELELGGFRIPKGWMIIAPSRNIQRMPELFSDPERYNPFRFAPGKEEHKLHPHSITGFGGNSHQCAGMYFARNEMATIVALMLQQYEWELVSDPQIDFRPGISQITESTLRYQKRKQPEQLVPFNAASYPTEVLAACPHLAQLAEAETREAVPM
ncbi:MAG TPA: hypothetical protein DCE41_04200 [Cytophagales bacterium]|nr:hypothetical protein [Cytophagales bacterium]HAA18478.1 hypothetical protein [Cytophagales bacterium]HAP61495.1 hypothetical protein [Cytophagales bacterium]